LGPGISIAGAGLALGVWVAERAGLRLPPWLLIPLGLVALGMISGGLRLVYSESRRSGDASLKDRLGLHRAACRQLAEEELRQIAIEHPLVDNSLRVFNRGAENTPREWMSAAREFIEVVQGPAAEARFAYADDPQDAAIEIAIGLDLSRLPSKQAIEAARDERRRSSGLYPQGIDQMIVPGWRLRSASPPPQDKAGLSPSLTICSAMG
jgi:hypothetical protein